MKILILAAISFVGVVASAQTVGPVFLEGKIGKKPFKGQFLVENSTVHPMPVVIEAKQLQAVDGKPVFGALLPGTVVSLKDSSAVVSPRSSRVFDYEVRCEKNCVVTFLAGMSGGKNPQGINIRLWLMSSAFLCSDSAKNCRTRTKKAMGLE